MTNLNYELDINVFMVAQQMKIAPYHILDLQQNQIHGQSVPEIDGFRTLFLDNMAPACLMMDQIDN